MSMTSSTLDDFLADKLETLQAQFRRQAIGRGLGRTALLLAVATGLGLAADWTWDLGSIVRVGLLVVTVLAVVASLARLFWTLRHGQPTLVELAAVVEEAHPELRDRLTTTLELNDPRFDEQFKGSAYMRKQLAAETVQQLKPLVLTEVISSRKAFRMLAVGGLALLLLLSGFFWINTDYGLLMARFFFPWKNLDSAGELLFEVQPGDAVVVRETDVEWIVQVRSRSGKELLRPPKEVWLNWCDAQGRCESRQMSLDDETGAFRTQWHRLLDDLTYTISSRRNRSREYKIEVVERPEVTNLRLEIQPPEYTRLPPQVLDGVLGNVSVYRDSELTFRLQFNKPVRQVELFGLSTPMTPEATAVLSGQATTFPPIDLPAGQAPSAVQLAEDGLSAQFTMTASKEASFAVIVADEHGLLNEPDSLRRLLLLADAPPTVEVHTSETPLHVRPQDSVQIPVTASDDIGLQSLELHVQIDRERTKVIPVEPESLTEPIVNHVYHLDLAPYQLPPAHVVTYRVRAVDTCPHPRPNEVWSDPRLLIIGNSTDPPGLAELMQQQREMRQELDELRKEVTEHRRDAETAHSQAELAQEQKRPFAENDTLPELAAEELKLAAKTEQLANRFMQHPLYQQLTEPLREVSRKHLAEANSRLNEATREDNLERKTPLLNETVQELKRSEKVLDKAADMFRELAELERDLLELNKLAEDVEQLAEDVADHEQRQQQMQADQQAQANQDQQDKQAENKADRQQLDDAQAALQDRHRALGDQLDELLERRPEIIDAAKKQQLERLKQLAEQARQLSKPQEQLANELKRQAQQDQRDSRKNKANDSAEQAEQSTDPQQAQQDSSQWEKLIDDQQRVSAEAARLALELAKKQGVQSPAARQAAELARKADQVGREVQTGQVDQANKSAEQAEEAAKNAAEQTNQASDETPAMQPLAEKADQLQQQQQSLRKQLQELSENKQARQQARSDGQQRLAEAAADLSRQFSESAEKLQADPLKLDQAGEKADRASQSTEKAEASMQEATERMTDDGNRAASKAQEAARALEQAAREAGAKQKSPESPVPGEVGEKVVDASQQLRQAQQSLLQQQRQNDQSAEQSDAPQPDSQSESAEQNQSEPSGDEAAQPGKQSSGDSSNQSQNKQQPPNPSTADQLREAARSLSKASEQLRPKSSDASKQMDNNQSNQSNEQASTAQSSSDNAAGTGAQIQVDLSTLESHLKAMSQRNWGQLPGELQTEILQGSRKRTAGEYAPLIKFYFQEINRQQAASAGSTNESDER